MNKPYLADKFNSFRKVRNAINYYGKDISAEEAKPFLKEMNEFIENIKKQFFGGQEKDD